MTDAQGTVTEVNKARVSEFHHRLWGQGDHAAIDDFFDPHAVVHFTGFDGSAVQTVRDDAARWWEAFDDVKTSIEDLLADGDRVVVRWNTSGRHIGDYGKVTATGKTITMSGIDIFRLENGRVVECWSMWDGIDVFDQLGVLPELW